MKIVLPGGTGQVGTILARAFHADHHEVVVLSRMPQPAPWRVVSWDGRVSAPGRASSTARTLLSTAGLSVELPLHGGQPAGDQGFARHSTRVSG